MTESIVERPFTSLSGCLYAAHGAYMIVAGFALAVFCWLLPGLLLKVVGSGVIDPDEVPALAQGVLEHRDLLPLLAIPVIVFGIVVVNKVRFRWVWIVLGLLSMAVPAVLLIYTFVASIGLLYQSHPL